MEAPKGFGSHEFTPFATALSYGEAPAWVLDRICTARRTRVPIRLHHLEFQLVTGKKTLVKSCLGQQWPESIMGVNDLN
jgi:hypothetical protein